MNSLRIFHSTLTPVLSHVFPRTLHTSHTMLLAEPAKGGAGGGGAKGKKSSTTERNVVRYIYNKTNMQYRERKIHLSLVRELNR